MAYSPKVQDRIAHYGERLDRALNRWLSTDRRSLLDIVETGDLSESELDNACDVAEFYDVVALDLVIEIGAYARWQIETDRRRDNGLR